MWAACDRLYQVSRQGDRNGRAIWQSNDNCTSSRFGKIERKTYRSFDFGRTSLLRPPSPLFGFMPKVLVKNRSSRRDSRQFKVALRHHGERDTDPPRLRGSMD